MRYRWSIQSTNKSKCSEDRLQLRLDEAAINKKVNEGMEVADKKGCMKTPFRNLNFTLPSSALDKGSSASESRLSSDVSPRTLSTPARGKRRGEDIVVVLGEGKQGDEAQKSLKKQSRDVVVMGPSNGRQSEDMGRYQIRCYRREARDGDEWRILRVRQYMYWAPK